ncbi:uncharacterized protein [Panulirus ornatus]|uniref:uncharacterized protein n=1 Tax=Panulirus ornatus TaxID=150431 RepID=UPI003A85505A
MWFLLLVAGLAALSPSQAHDVSQNTRPAVKPQVIAPVQTLPEKLPKVSPQHPAPVQTLPEKLPKVSPQHPAPVQTLPEKVPKVSPQHPAPVQTLPENLQRPQVLPPRPVPGPSGYLRPFPRPYGGSGIWDGSLGACRSCYRLSYHFSSICCRRHGTCC